MPCVVQSFLQVVHQIQFNAISVVLQCPLRTCLKSDLVCRYDTVHLWLSDTRTYSVSILALTYTHLGLQYMLQYFDPTPYNMLQASAQQ